MATSLPVVPTPRLPPLWRPSAVDHDPPDGSVRAAASGLADRPDR